MKIKLSLMLACLFSLTYGYAQRDSTFFFRADLSVTNNGFSIIPAFTLGDPAVFLDMRMGNKRLSFEPQFRYALEGRPWSFIFIYRYKAIIKPKFQLSFGGHLPGLNYVTRTVMINGIQEELSVARRFLALEVIPTYKISDHVNVGIYYLRGHGFQKHGPQNSNFLSLQGNFTKIKLADKTYVSFSPQLFYLKVDADDGFYANATTMFGIRDFPITISGIVNKAMKSDIPAQDFDWSINMIYTLDKQFTLR
ncbi:MAG: hypothetical protein KF725_15475 [Cyclobacteriaceae bacterium]|nr:hypothetical protein [Cyclobacteriaceae bacterium]UYN87741.1 MAG: hypothetical protein KIT51_05655 [Cyclobacteriaceae bacterium]